MTEQDYKIMLKDKLIEYRDTLNLPENVTFGVEIEYENIPIDTVTHLLSEQKKLIDWRSKRELDIEEYNPKIKEDMNGEVISPILIDSKENWNNLKSILDMLDKNGAIVTKSCGGHVNIGAHLLENNQEYWRNFLLLWILYYKEIYNFSSGEFLKVRTRRKNILDNSSIKLRKSIRFILSNYSDIELYLNDGCGLIYGGECDLSIPEPWNVRDKIEDYNRIEFRIPNATLREKIWQNYINFFAKFVLSSKKELDIERTLYKIKNKESNALELADYIFDNDIDKQNFLIQTLKTNKVYKKELPEHKIYY